MKVVYFFILSVIFLVACENEEIMIGQNDIASISDVSDEAWKTLAQKRIYFGHQSVGGNVIDGVRDVMESNKSIRLNIKGVKDNISLDSPVFLHSNIGKNGDPVGKIIDFKNKIDGGIGEKTDIAFAKLCFWDVHRSTNVEKIFSEYKTAITGLKKSYPNTYFMHMTVPLMSHSDSLIDRLKRLIRDDNDDLDNVKRNELNEMILKEYKGKESVFDIAKFESTKPNGMRSFFIKDGKKYYYLTDVYTKDSGHLNKQGRRFIAEQLLIKLLEISKN